MVKFCKSCCFSVERERERERDNINLSISSDRCLIYCLYRRVYDCFMEEREDGERKEKVNALLFE
jgi:hypothetical protein